MKTRLFKDNTSIVNMNRIDMGFPGLYRYHDDPLSRLLKNKEMEARADLA